MNITVTGGSGFLGTALIAALTQNGHQVQNVDLVPSEFANTIVGDIQDSVFMEKVLQGQEVVYHLASLIEVGESVAEPMRYFENNVLGTISVLEGMRKNKVSTFIFSSSAAVYGAPVRVPVMEDDRTLPINPYGTTKLAMEGLASSYAYNFGMNCTALRYFNLYGPGNHRRPASHVIPRFYNQLANNEEVTIWGDGMNERDYVYLDEVVQAHLLALQLSPGYHYYNLSGRNATKVIDLLHLMAKIMQKTPNIRHFPPRQGDPMQLFADAGKAKRELRWESTMPLEDGLRTTIAWYQQHPPLRV